MDLIPSKANEPVLGEGMKAVYWTNENGAGETTATAYTSSMYNYTIGDGKTDSKNSKWANAITIEDGSYWVWIPRYAYKITYTNNGNSEFKGQTTATSTISGEKTPYGNIDILFMYGKSNTHYRDENGNAVPLPEGYKVHPAFQAMNTSDDLTANPLGKWDEELKGIWVAKYEASMETTTDGWATWKNQNTYSSVVGDVLTSSKRRVVSKPSVQSWSNIRESYMYQNSLNMHPELNSHQMKNSEWGVVAYLTESAYGRNGNEIAVNQRENFYTGAGPGIGTSEIYNSTYSVYASTFEIQYAWNTTQGKLASTTGNIYGVYDMSGGSWENTAAYIAGGNDLYVSGDSYGGVLGTSTDMKTKQVYAGTNYAENSDVYGDAVYETSIYGNNITRESWHNDDASFPSSNGPIFGRGGVYIDTSEAGVFNYLGGSGKYLGGTSFRPVLCVSDEYKVTLNPYGGTVSTNLITVVKDGTYGSLPTPEKEGYDFLGWYTENGEKVTSTTPIVKNANHRLIAKWNGEIMDLIPSKANAPVLGDGMKAVYWTNENGIGETTADAYTSSMYNYTMGDGKTDSKDSKWANAITIEDGSYWVWIPRYAYKITYTDSTRTNVSSQTTATSTIDGEKTQYGNIDILFMHGKSNTHYRDENGNAVALPEGYKVHPAFQKMTTSEDLKSNPLGKWDEELEGIWVAKYEASMETTTDGGATWTNTNTSSSSIGDVLTSSTVRVVSKPSVISWRNIRQNYIYQNSLNMHEELNSHEMKNSEWGAVAYLTESAYGRNGNEIAVNQCENFYTGAGPETGVSTVNNSEYSYNSSTFANQYAWNTTQGKLASTTGNIYGVYDMSGGAYEYTAAYIAGGDVPYVSGDLYGGVLGTDLAELKTKQMYEGKTDDLATNYALNKTVYGDAVYETSIAGNNDNESWYGDNSSFSYARYPFFLRGGRANDGSTAGAFAFDSYEGSRRNDCGFRIVLCVQSGT